MFNGEFHWVEYRENNTVTMPPNPRSQWVNNVRMERSTGSYEGRPAIHDNTTYTMDYPEWIGDQYTVTQNGQRFFDDSYYDPSTNRLLGETTVTMIKGVKAPGVDSSAYYAKHIREDSPGGWLGITPFGEMNITLADQGTKSVTVPAGTYPDARVYTGRFGDGTPITFWVVPGIPVPVQYQFPNRHLDGVDPFQSYELVGWG